MEIAVLSDIHSNYVALERCLAYAFSRDIKTFIFLGDYVAELAYPQRTMQLLYDLSKSYQCYFIKGNKEEYWLNYRSSGEKGWSDMNSTTGALLYTYNELTSKDLGFFEQMQPALEVTMPGYPALTICHGSPFEVNEKMLPDDPRTFEMMDSANTSTILCGHTHVQRKIVHNNKYTLNPGAVGISHCSQGKTQFLLLQENNGGWEEEFISLEYDVEKVIRELHEVGLYEHAPYWSLITESNLRGGNVSHGTVLVRAMELCRKETGKCIWPDIPEHCWAEAVKEKIIN